MKPSGVITLLTDFGTKDPYVGAMKGVILSINPEARIVDITHEVEPQDIRGAAFCMLGYLGYFPRGTVHVCVVDPGVGSSRRAVAIKTRDFYLVGPDNGVFTLALDRFGCEEIVLLENCELLMPRISQTFHGRDIFAPAAAHISSGVGLDRFGPQIDEPVRFDWSEVRIEADRMVGRIVHFDRFGNAITNIDEAAVREFLAGAVPIVSVGGWSISGLASSYAEAVGGKLCAVIDSYGFVEIAVPMGDARKLLRLNLGDEVWIRRGE